MAFVFNACFNRYLTININQFFKRDDDLRRVIMPI